MVARLEKRFVNINSIIQKMFLKLDSMERWKEKDFVLETLLHEFDDIVKKLGKYLLVTVLLVHILIFTILWMLGTKI